MASFTLTTGPDTVVFGAADDTVNGTAATLNANDSLTGDGGLDTLALSGSGTFRVDQLATFAGFERITLDNATAQSALLVLGNQAVEVDTTGKVTLEADSLANWNGSNIVNGDLAGNTTVLFSGPMPGPRPTYDLTSNTFSHVKIDLQFATLLVNSAAMAGVQSVSGDSDFFSPGW